VDSRPEELVLAAESAPVGARGLFFLPHLMGERGDGVRPHARGEIVGLTLAHTRADLARAVLEGTAYWLRAVAGDELDRRRPAELVAAGGGAASRLWLRILAAVLDRDIEVPEVAEAGLLGAALLAATGIGAVDNLAAGQERWVRRRGVVRTDPVWCQQYQDFYQGFQQAEYRAHPGSGPVASVSQTDPQLAAQRRPAHHPQ
jgi:xylulokinase